MPILSTLFAQLVLLFSTWFTGRAAVGTAFVAGSLLIFGIMAGVITALVSTVYMSVPATLSSALSIVPTNVAVCISALQTAVIAKWLYSYKLQVMETLARV